MPSECLYCGKSEGQCLLPKAHEVLTDQYRIGTVSGQYRDKTERLCEEILSVIDRSGIEDIYNWGAPLREIRALIAAKGVGHG